MKGTANLSDLAFAAQKAWGEAHSISSGAGCTPFYADARDASCRYVRAFKSFEGKHPRIAKRLKEEYPHSSELERSTRAAE